MKLRLIKTGLLFAALITALTAWIILSGRRADDKDARAEQAVIVSEIGELYKTGDTARADELSAELREELMSASDKKDDTRLIFMGALSLVFMGGVLCYVYFSILRPFDKMKHFADEIAKGNFELPLDYERSNYFGSFTWAFDSMRREITKSRRCEREAIENNKTVIATLSHDIKTPISSIRAYAEGLEANLDSTPEKRARYLSVLMRKCVEVAALTNDLFLHSLADLDKLKMNKESIELSSFIKQTVDEISGDRGDVHLTLPDTALSVSADRNRLTQLCENLINNARKYAKTDIDLSLSEQNGEAVLTFRDFGKGIPDEDMPFITDKFYRGHNCGSEQGSGLGLYIVSYICSQLGGSLTLRNASEGGLIAEVKLPLEKPVSS